MSAQGANLNPILLYLQSVGASAQVIMLWRLCVLGGRGERGGGGDWERTGGRERERKGSWKKKQEKRWHDHLAVSPRVSFLLHDADPLPLSLSLSLSIPTLVALMMLLFSALSPFVFLSPTVLFSSCAPSLFASLPSHPRPPRCLSLSPPVNTPNKKPQGFQVAPFLIAVSPVGAGIQAQGFAVQPTDIAIGDVGAGFSAQANFFGPTKYAWNPILGADITPPDKRGRPPAWAKDLPPKTGAAAAAAEALAGRARASASASSNAAGAASSSSSPSGSGGGSSDSSSSSSIVGDVDPSAGLLRRRRRSLFLADSSEGTVRGSDAGSFDGGSTGDDGADDGAGASGLQRQLKRRILLSVTSSNDGEGSSDKLGGRGDNSNNVHAGDGSASEAAAGTTTISGQKKLILNLDDPFDLSSDFPSDYRNWAAVLSQVLLKKEGFGNERKRKSVDDHGDVLSRGSSSGGDKFGAALAPDARRDAVAALERVMLATHGHLAKAASGEEFFPRFHLRDPVFEAERGPSATEAAAVGLHLPPSAFLLPSFVDGGVAAASNKSTTTAPRKKKIANTRLSADATFFNFSPCVISESATGSAASLTGLNFAPSLINFAATVLSAQVTGEICFSKSCFFPAQPSSHLFFHLLYVEQIMKKTSQESIGPLSSYSSTT